jgi:hypothetical protein
VEQETEVEVEEEERVKRRGVDEVGSGRKGAGEQGGSDGRLVVGYWMAAKVRVRNKCTVVFPRSPTHLTPVIFTNLLYFSNLNSFGFTGYNPARLHNNLNGWQIFQFIV